MNRAFIHEWFAQTANQYADCVAVERGDTRLTYREVDARANKLADQLHRQGAQKGDVVALVFQNTSWYVVGLLGSLKAGCIFMALDPAAPLARSRVMMRVAEPRWLLTSSEHLDLVPRLLSPERLTTVMSIDGEPATADALYLDFASLPETQAPQVLWEADDPCYIYFTSGSTGEPRGITGRLKAIDHFIAWEIETLGLAPGCRVSQLTAPTFDAILRDIFVPLCSGGTLCIPPDVDTVLNPRALAQWIQDADIHLIHCVPSLFRTLLGPELELHTFANLGHVLLSGELLLASDVARWMDVHQDRVTLINLYGPSETTMVKLFYKVQDSDRDRTKIPIGQPMRGARALIVDEEGKVCPPGVVGEIWIRTPYRSLGYYKQPDQTSRSFIVNPFNNDPNDLIYKTGDLGRMLNDRNLEWVGRKDHQIKLRGLRIELGEIEALLSRHEDIRQATVIVRDEGRGPYLAAYILPSNPAVLATDAVAEQGYTNRDLSHRWHGYLAESLPPAMIPSAFILMKEYPKTLSGKVNRQALPAPQENLQEAREGAPRTPEEEIVAEIFRDLLGRHSMGLRDDFFESGGHSLLATQVLARIHEIFGIELSFRSLFSSFNVATIASMLAAKDRIPQPPLERKPADAPDALSFGQSRLWFQNRYEPSGSAYNVTNALEMQGPLDGRAIEAALHGVIQRHEVLRTHFPMQNELPVQRVSPPGPWTLDVIDLSGLEQGTRKQALSALVAREAGHAFNLTQGPVFRQLLLRLQPQEHALLSNMHHIISDAWSMGVLVKEVMALYREQTEGIPADLPELPVQYADYAHWQRQWLTESVLEAQVAYWRDQLAGAAPLLNLPLDKQRPSRRTYSGAELGFSLGPELSAALRMLSRNQGVTLFMLLHAAFATLLSRFSSETDIVIGSPVAGRGKRELEPLIGYFVNNLVIRTRLNPDQGFNDLLTSVRATVLDAMAHQDLPFEQMVEVLKVPRSLSHSPIFQVTLTLQNAPGALLDLSSLKLRAIESNLETAKFEMMLIMGELDEILHGTLQFNTDLFHRETIAQLADSLLTLLKQVTLQPDRPLSQLALMPEAVQHKVLHTWNETTSAYPQAGLGRIFSEVAAKHAERTALIAESTLVDLPQQMTYAQLDERSNQLAHYLLKQGLSREGLVCISMPRGLEGMIAILAVLKSGATYLPLESDNPLNRLSAILADSQPAFLITTDELLDRLPIFELSFTQILVLTEHWDQICESSTEPVNRDVDPDQLAYIMYTSGSTGLPKAVQIPHRGVARLVLGSSFAELGANQVTLQMAPVAFDASTFEMWAALLHGGTCVLFPDEAPSAQRLAAIITQYGVTTLWLTASLFHYMVDTAPETLRPLKQLLAGGEALSPAHVQKVSELLPELRLINGYGPTESTTFACCHTVPKPCVASQGSIPIGTPIANTRVFILDRLLAPVPVGFCGELFIAGDGLARGYLNKAALTAQAFIPNPHASHPGERLYRTGDKVRRLRSGLIDFLGRIDNQIKLRGFRIELGEIEAALNQYPGVSQAVVIVREDATGEKGVVAYLTWHGTPDSEPQVLSADDRAKVRDYLKNRLPDYMMPRRYISMAAIPLTANGKVDFRSLPLPESLDAQTTAHVPPESEVEQQLAALWEAILNHRPVGRYDNFFDLGGHSLLAARLADKIQEHFKVELALHFLFESPTLASLATKIEEAAEQVPDFHKTHIKKLFRGGPLPLAFAQERLLPLVPHWGAMVHTVHIEGQLDSARLQRALSLTVARQEATRTRFDLTTSPVTLSIIQAEGVQLSFEDLSSSEAESSSLDHFILRSCQVGFHGEAPPIRQALVKLDDHRHALVISMSPLIGDPWSLGLFAREALRFYQLLGEGLELPELPVQHLDYAHWQRQLVARQDKEALAFWKTHLDGRPAVAIPPSALNGQHRWVCQALTHAFEGESLGHIQRLARQAEVPSSDVLLAVFATLLGRYCGQDDLVVGMAAHSRSTMDVEGFVGPLYQVLPLRVSLESQNFANLLQQLRQSREAVLDWANLPFEQVWHSQAHLAESERYALPICVDSSFVPEPESPEGLQVKPYASPWEGCEQSLRLSIRDRGTQIECRLLFAPEIFEANRMHLLLGHMLSLVQAVVSQPSTPVLQLPLMSERLRTKVLVEMNDTQRGFAKGRPAQQLFERQASKTPQIMALQSGLRTLTYGELDQRANQLAHLLREKGLTQGAQIGVQIDALEWRALSALAILKLGAVVVCLDDAPVPMELDFLITAQASVPAGAIGLRVSELELTPYTTESLEPPPGGDTPAVRVRGTHGWIELSQNTLMARLYWGRGTFPSETLQGVWFEQRHGHLGLFHWLLPLSWGGAALDTIDATPTPTFILASATKLRHELATKPLPSTVQVCCVTEDPDRELRELLSDNADLKAYRVFHLAEAGFVAAMAPLMPRENGPLTLAPTDNTRLFILDAWAQPLPPHTWGVLYLGGDGAAMGSPGTGHCIADSFSAGVEACHLFETGLRACRDDQGGLTFFPDTPKPSS